jgi:hypothetical protein
VHIDVGEGEALLPVNLFLHAWVESSQIQMPSGSELQDVEHVYPQYPAHWHPPSFIRFLPCLQPSPVHFILMAYRAHILARRSHAAWVVLITGRQFCLTTVGVGERVGLDVKGAREGRDVEGALEGLDVEGAFEGAKLGFSEGREVLGLREGVRDGRDVVGAAEGLAVGALLGTLLGA